VSSVRWPRWLRTHPALACLWRDDILQRGYLIAVALSAALLAALWGGGDARFSSAAFETMRVLGGRPAWCGLLGALLLGLLASRVLGPSVLRWTLLGAGVVYILFAVAFLIAALHSPTSALTGPPAYAALALFHLSHALDYRPGDPRAIACQREVP
jgi:hypothetical protein